MNTQNTYSKGMNKDLSPYKMSNGHYEDMRNFKVVTDSGSSFGAIVNEKGNRLDFTIPSLGGVYSLDLDVATSETGIININGTPYFISFASDATATVIGKALQEHFSANIANGEFTISYTNGRVVLVALDEELTLIDPDGFFNLEVPELENLYTIGWTRLNDQIILFTTSNTDDTITNGDGQIWAVDYNEADNEVIGLTGNSLTPSVHLKYNGLVNFCTEKSITRALTRYENSNTARVYFTDFYNPVRSFNLLDPEGLALDPLDFNLAATIDFTKPVFTDISDGGSLPTGSVVQTGYRLIGNGKVSNVSPMTNVLPLYELDDETDLYRNIKGTAPSLSTNQKSVTFTISDLDISYSQIEYIFVVYTTKDVPVVYSLIENLSSSSVVKTFTGGENDLVILTEDEISLLVTDIDKAKDLTIKDDRLIAANLLNERFEIKDSEFDARAYRYDDTGTSRIYQSNGSETVVPVNFDVDLDHDAINPFNNIDDPNYGEYKYQSDGTTIGGEGPNISYTFITKEIIGDERGDAGSPPYVGALNRATYEELLDGQITHEINDQFNNYISPFVHNIYTGYQREEVYRFAIVFRSKNGDISFAKWIGDIKFPTVNEFPLINDGDTTDNDPLNLNVLGIKFEVSLPDSVKNKVSSYEIVRLERTDKDKSVWGGGGFDLVTQSGDDLIRSNTHIGNLGSTDVSVENGLNGGSGDNKEYAAYVAPIILFENSGLRHQSGDYIKMTNTNSLSNFVTISGGAGQVELEYRKFYNHEELSTDQTVDVFDWHRIDPGENYTISNIHELTTYTNFQNKSNTGIDDMGHCGLLVLNGSLDTGAIGSFNVPYGLYCRTLASQYGGTTFESRSFNTYITTGTIVTDVDDNDIEVFGGDTYVTYFMYEHVNDPSNGTYEDKISTGKAFACESPFNVELRHGNYFAKNRFPSDNSGNDPFLNYEREQYAINKVYFQQPNVSKVYQAKNFLVNTVQELPFTIWASQPKINGEIVDSWANFLANNQVDVNGTYGPINSIHNYKDKVLFYQDSAFGVVAINERVTVPDEQGTQLIIGNGQVLGDYAYISKHTGCFHRTGVVLSENNVYHFDIRQKKLWRYSINSKTPLSDIKGMSAFLYDLVSNTQLEDTDNPTSFFVPYNVHGTYDHRYNRVLFTFLTAENVLIEDGDRPPLIEYTVSYNELLDGFESSYDFHPKLYLSTGRKLLSIDPTGFNNEIYQHNEGNYCEFYGDKYRSSITYLINAGNHLNKQWNNLSWITDVYNNNQDVPDDTFNFLRVSNNYQDTQQITLTSPERIRRRFRFWRTAVPRDANTDGNNSRITNPWARIELRYENTNGYRMVMHDLNTFYRVTAVNNYQ